MDLKELDQEIVKLELKQEVGLIALNKLKAYYWLLKNYDIHAEKIQKVIHVPGQNKSRIYMKNRVNDDDHHVVPGDIHNALCGLDTTYSLPPKAKRYNDILIKQGDICKSKDANLLELKQKYKNEATS
tara:strand:+ start:46 stop:429 length:384 start_codon:yes stop_codon:yes gene_type:complete